MLKSLRMTKVGRLKMGVHLILPTLKFKTRYLGAAGVEQQELDHLDLPVPD
jgi:hypothetical protein